VEGAEAKQAKDIHVLNLRERTGFTDFLIICHGTNPRQVQAITDEVEKRLKEIGERALNIEGYTHGEWILMDYGDFVINVFSEKARAYYDLERLWRDAKRVQ
jgi:ribosome-associated protein